MNSNLPDRIPVIYKKVALTPCTRGRAYHLVTLHKGIFVYDKHIGWYLKLKVPPSGYHTSKDCVLGIDTGTMFIGSSVIDEKGTLINVELEQTRKMEDRNFIKNHSKSRSGNRRLKRSRLRWRKVRFSNRTGSKITSTENYYYQNIRNLAEWLIKFYPIKHIIIEDIKFNHFVSNKGRSFSPIEQIKTKLYKKLRSHCTLQLVGGSDTADIRADHFKTKNKASKSFSAHCVDSHAIASSYFGAWMPCNENIIYLSRRLPKIDEIRRYLVKFQKRQGAKLRGLSKLKKIRVKIDDKQGNSGPWKYMYTVPGRTVSKIIRYHGGSIYHANKRGHYYGQNKYYNYLKNHFDYYNLQFIKAS